MKRSNIIISATTATAICAAILFAINIQRESKLYAEQKKPDVKTSIVQVVNSNPDIPTPEQPMTTTTPVTTSAETTTTTQTPTAVLSATSDTPQTTQTAETTTVTETECTDDTAETYTDTVYEDENSAEEEYTYSNICPYTGYELLYNDIYYVTDDHLTYYGGVKDFNGHHETFYSENVLPGPDLDIPGRHVAYDGTIRDEDGYICVAADPSYMAYGTVLLTTLGPAKVYDTGCAYSTIDIYTNW